MNPMQESWKPIDALKSKPATLNWLPFWLQGWAGYWALAATAYVVLYASWIFFKWGDPAYESWIAGLGYLPLGLFSAISSIYAASRSHLDARTRRAWQFIAMGSISLSVADIIYVSLDLTKGVGFPDIPDIFYLAYYPLVVAGLISIPTWIRNPQRNKTWALDLAIFAASAGAILWYFIIAPTAVAGGADWFTQLVAGAYPAMGLLVLVSVVSILFRQLASNTRQALYMLGLGLLFYVTADLIYAKLVLLELYVDGSWVDILWTLSYLTVGVAALRQSHPHLIERGDQEESQVSWWASALPFSAVAISVIVSGYASIAGFDTGFQTKGLLIGTAATILLAIVRQAITLRENAQLVKELNSATSQLRANASTLEQRVAERTRELEKQTFRLRLAADVARDIASATNLDELLARSTYLISERFNLYHTGIFLVDKKREYAALIASPTAAGRQMIANDYRLEIDGMNIVSQVASTGEPRIVLNSGADTIYFDNPLLPNTLSEMALPLKVETSVIGVLDAQSDQPQAFTADDIAIMQIMADQLAIAIERTRLMQQVESNLNELEGIYGRYTRESWKGLASDGRTGSKGYRFDNIRLQPITELPELGSEALATGKTISSKGDGQKSERQNMVAIPIKLRGQTIGVVSVKLMEGYDETTISTLEAAAERLAYSMENARLYEEARQRADREHSISQVTSSISSAIAFDDILRTTVREVGNIISDSEVTIQILDPTEEENS